MSEKLLTGIQKSITLRVTVLVIALICGVFSLFALPAGGTLFSADAYRRTLDEQGAYRRFPLLLSEMLARGGDSLLFSGGKRLQDAMSRVGVDRLAEDVFPEPWVRDQAGSLLDQFWGYFNFQRPQFTLVVDLRPVKARLAGQGAQVVAADILKGLPGCTADEVLNYVMGALSGSPADLPLCRPPQELEGAAEVLVTGILNGSANAIPDQVDLAPTLRFAPLLAGERASAAWQRGFAMYRFMRAALSWIPWLWLALLALLAGISWRAARGPLYWTGTAFLGSGAAAALLALLLGLWARSAAGIAAGALVGEQPVALDMLAGMVGGVFLRYSQQVLQFSLAAAVIGAAMIVVPVLIQKMRPGS